MTKLAEYYAQVGVRGVNTVLGAFGRVKAGLNRLAAASTAPIRKIGGMLSGLATPAGLAGMALGYVGVRGAGGILKLASEVESLDTQFRVLLGSGEAAKRMMADINKFAASTPFEQMQLAGAAKQLLAYGVASQNIIPIMRRLGDISALSGARLEDLVGIYGKVKGQGKLTAETLEQFQVRGIPITRELAKQFGVAETQVRGLVSQGKIGFAEVEAALAALTDKGGQFAGGMEQLAKTTGGLWSTVTGNLKTLLANFGTVIIKALNVKGLLEGLGNWIGQMADALGFLAENWNLYLSIMWEKFKLFIRNLPEYFRTGVRNLVILVRWFARNWRDIFVTIWRYTTTVFGNLIKNLRELWSSFWEFIKTGRWQFDWTPLTEGFRSAIKEMPELVEAKVQQSTPALERLTAELERRRREYYGKRGGEEGGTGATGPVPSPAATAAGAAGAGGISFVGIAALAKQMQQEAGKRLQEQMAKASQQTADATGKLAGAVAGGAVRVEIVRGGQTTARYGR